MPDQSSQQNAAPQNGALASPQPKNHGIWLKLAHTAIGLGALGFVVILFLAFRALQQAVAGAPAADCVESGYLKVVPPAKPVDGIQITAIQPVNLVRNRALCVRVSNVVPADKLSALSAAVTVASKAVSDAAAGYQSAVKARSATPSEQTLAQAQAADAAQTKAKADLANAQAALDAAQKARTISLYLNGKPSPITAPARAIAEEQDLAFDISAPEDANSATAGFWRDLLSQPSQNGRIMLRLGVAEQGQPAPVGDWRQVASNRGRQEIGFQLYKPQTMCVVGLALAAILVGLLGLSYQTTLLRSGSDVTNAYSLSLVQMAVWLVLTLAGFIYVWLVTGQYVNVFTSGLFVLIGISGATASVAQAVNGAKGQVPQSRNFICDIVGYWQGGSVQLQRIQIIAWTLILAMIFCWNVITKLVLTSFDTNLLVLTGIANGVYVSLKPQE